MLPDPKEIKHIFKTMSLNLNFYKLMTFSLVNEIVTKQSIIYNIKLNVLIFA